MDDELNQNEDSTQNNDVESNSSKNKKAKELKMTNTTFNNPSGLDQDKGNNRVVKEYTELLDMINEGLQNVIDNGTYDQLLAKWGL